jgi:hypothetical protein
MRLIMMHNTNAHWEAGNPPSAALVAEMGKLTEEMMQAGVMLGGEGLRQTSLGVRLNFSGGERKLRHGPYGGPGPLNAGFLVLRLQTVDEAVEWATRLGRIVGDSEIDVRPVCEPWDLGFCPPPAGLDTTRYMLVYKADGQSEAAIAAAVRGPAMARLIGEMRQAGVFLAFEPFQPSAQALRLAFAGEQRSVTDGPFSESKEVIGGYCMVEVAGMDEALRWSTRFAGVVGDVELDIRRLYDPPLHAAHPVEAVAPTRPICQPAPSTRPI